ncbi:hypothetical protein OHB13_05000 [Streptomyces sp. NBC_00440]|uniref:hypothetical protein n=1 Tax=unclassified Streptomyces TaxID=2593676 RepID=UPI002E251B08|nr:hypothetical protein OG221_32580 [Streptomyces sp. NBC_00932]
MELDLADGAGVTLTAGAAGVRLTARTSPQAPETVLHCSPAQARELAAALVRAAGEAQRAQPTERVTVEARELRRGDVRDSDRSMTVERVRALGDTVQVTWKSDAGRSWTQDYAAGTGIGIRHRG